MKIIDEREMRKKKNNNNNTKTEKNKGAEAIVKG